MAASGEGRAANGSEDDGRDERVGNDTHAVLLLMLDAVDEQAETLGAQRAERGVQSAPNLRAAHVLDLAVDLLLTLWVLLVILLRVFLGAADEQEAPRATGVQVGAAEREPHELGRLDEHGGLDARHSRLHKLHLLTARHHEHLAARCHSQAHANLTQSTLLLLLLA